jgi:hypothetical protein
MCPGSGRSVPVPHVSAVIGLDWFDSLNKNRREPTISADPVVFEPFCQVRRRRAGTVWLPDVTGDPNMVMATDASDELEYGPYNPG